MWRVSCEREVLFNNAPGALEASPPTPEVLDEPVTVGNKQPSDCPPLLELPRRSLPRHWRSFWVRVRHRRRVLDVGLVDPVEVRSHRKVDALVVFATRRRSEAFEGLVCSPDLVALGLRLECVFDLIRRVGDPIEEWRETPGQDFGSSGATALPRRMHRRGKGTEEGSRE